jgi:hypothetical protein
MKISEAQVQQAVVQFLEADGWRAIRTDPVSDRSRGKGFGELGMPDYLFLRYAAYAGEDGARLFPNMTEAMRRSEVEVVWIEFKRKDEKPTPHQQKWHYRERQRGALGLVVDDIDEFTEWYKASGLCRRIL